MTRELTEAEAAALHDELERLAEQLAASLASLTNSARPVELDQPAVGRVSRVDALQQQSMAVANRAAVQARLGRVRAALAAAAAGEYGLCRECEEPIGYPRLKARPESSHCIACQRARERGGP